MKSVWVFGAGRSIGKALARELVDQGYAVTAFGRTGCVVENGGHLIINEELDFTDTPKLLERVKHWLRIRTPDVAVFCQRYRPTPGTLETVFDSLARGARVELGPSIIVAGEAPKCRQIVLTSAAALHPVTDQGLDYHVRKAEQAAMVVFFRSRGVDADCVVLGDVRKYPLESYAPRERSVMARALSIEDIVHQIMEAIAT